MLTPSGPIFAVVSLLMIMGAALLIFLTLLGGAIDNNPTNQFYFIEADTSGIGDAAATSRWTFWSSCSVLNGRNSCPHVQAAYPFDPSSNFGATSNVPPPFLGYAAIPLLELPVRHLSNNPIHTTFRAIC